MTSLCCNSAVTTSKKKFTINYKHWFEIRNLERTKIRSLDISLNNRILPKLPKNVFPKKYMFLKIYISQNKCFMKSQFQNQ